MKNHFFKTVSNTIKHWYLPLIMGIVFIATSIWTFASPSESYLALTIVFSISFLITGIIEVVFAVSNRKEMDNWIWTFILGVLTTVIGVFLLTKPEISVITLPIYIGFIVLFRSFSAIGFAMDLKHYGILQWGNLMALGVLGVIFSFLLIWNPIFAGVTIVFLTGILLFLIGFIQIYIALKLRKLHEIQKIPKELMKKFNNLKQEISDEIKKGWNKVSG